MQPTLSGLFIYLFLRNPVSRTAELFKKFMFFVVFFFCAQKKHSAIKYFGKILECL